MPTMAVPSENILKKRPRLSITIMRLKASRVEDCGLPMMLSK